MKILKGKGESIQLVEFEDGMYGIGVVYDDGTFNGTTFFTLDLALIEFNFHQNAISSYFKKFGTANE